MGPGELEEFLDEEPFTPLRLTLASGDQVVIESRKRVLRVGLSMYVGVSNSPADRIASQLKIVSIPNIVLVDASTGADRKPADAESDCDARH